MWPLPLLSAFLQLDYGTLGFEIMAFLTSSIAIERVPSVSLFRDDRKSAPYRMSVTFASSKCSFYRLIMGL